MKKKLVALLMSAVMASALLAGCGTAKDAETEQETVEDAAETETEAGSKDADAAAEDANAEAESEESNESNESADAQAGEAVVLKCVCDLTPHSEILNAAADLLSEKGIELDIVSTTWDATWNDMLVDGEIDFAYFMHVPAMESIEEEMGATLYSMGGIHVDRKSVV